MLVLPQEARRLHVVELFVERPTPTISDDLDDGVFEVRQVLVLAPRPLLDGNGVVRDLVANRRRGPVVTQDLVREYPRPDAVTDMSERSSM